MATFSRPKEIAEIERLPLAFSDPGLLLEDISNYFEDVYQAEYSPPEWDARIDESRLPSNRFFGLEPE